MPSAIPANQVTTPPELNSLGTPASNKTTIDKDGFLKMFVAQLQNQDPTNGMNATESVQQMTSFSMVEQITNMALQNTKIAQSMTNANAVGLIGRTVTYVDADKVEQTGTVESVATAKDGTTTLTIAGQSGIDPTSITQVA
jgi:flagellar basal-body rod modification protein FlgD